jgi:hypothetical protein
MKEKIKNIVTDSIEKLKQNLMSKFDIKQVCINQDYFDEKYKSLVNVTTAIKDFEDLLKINNPVLYWFEFKSFEDSNKKIRDKYENYRNNIKNDYLNLNYRNTSSFKSKFEMTSKTLYVGKVESGFWGRFVTHLGYNKTPKTAGMQLFYWYDIENFGDLTLNYIEFDHSMKHLITILEKQLALELKPLIGKY